ncbi:hypothetical protein LUZ60_014769 [Juncus effusus]|nr:hypothetical protein LUZ60_014769 [Juncus effusus]
MRALQYFPTIEDPNARRALFEVLQRILMGTDVVKNVNKNNASHAVLFEALALVMHLDAEKEMMSQCVALLGKFIAVREPNIRYLGLENMTRMLLVTDVQDIIKRHQAQIITSLKDPDISIRRRALDLLYGMCDVTNAKDIVEELLQYLNTAEFAMLSCAEHGNSPPPQLSLVPIPSQPFEESGQMDQEIPPENGAVAEHVTDQAPVVTEPVPVQPEPKPVMTEPVPVMAEPASPPPRPPSGADLLVDLLGPLMIEGPPPAQPAQPTPPAQPAQPAQPAYNAAQPVQPAYNQPAQPAPVMQNQGPDLGQELAGALAITTLEDQSNLVQVFINIAEKFHLLCFKDSGVLYEDPYIQIGVKADWRAHHGRLVLFLGNKNTAPLFSVRAIILPPAHLKIEFSSVPDTIPPRAQVQCPLEVVNLKASRDLPVLDFSYKFGAAVLRLPAVFNKFLQLIALAPEAFFPQWKALAGPPLKIQDVVRGVKPMGLQEMANLLLSLHIAVTPGLDTNPNNMVACTTFYSESTRAMLCLIRVETDPSDRTQLRMTVASGDPLLTFELKEFVKEHLISIPTAMAVPSSPVSPPIGPQSPPAPASYNDPVAMLAGLL